MNTLVIVLGQTRSATITAERWDKHFRSVVKRDGNTAIALCRCTGYTEEDPFFERNADFIWERSEPNLLNEDFDREALRLGARSDKDWRAVLDVEGNWLSELWDANGKRPGAAARCLLLRHHALSMIRDLQLHRHFERCIITRSDLLYTADHPPLSALSHRRIWVQRGQDYGGIPDRHNILPMRDVAAMLDVLSPILLHARRLRQLMLSVNTPWNVESYMKLMLIWHGRHHLLRRFPNTMFLVRSEQAGSGWAEGVYDPTLGFRVKYPEEKQDAERNAAALAACNYDPAFIARQTWRERCDTVIHSLPPWSLPLSRQLRERKREAIAWVKQWSAESRLKNNGS
jgi:hypothetical protein